MKFSFNVPFEYFDVVKTFVRKYQSLRHIVDPHIIGPSAYFYISGNVEDFNKFNCDLESLLQPSKEERKENFIKKILNIFTKKP